MPEFQFTPCSDSFAYSLTCLLWPRKSKLWSIAQRSVLHITCREEGHEVEVRVTYEPGDSDRIVEEALAAKNVDAIVAAGGDGSVNEVKLHPE